jgi:hypothetical protein
MSTERIVVSSPCAALPRSVPQRSAALSRLTAEWRLVDCAVPKSRGSSCPDRRKWRFCGSHASLCKRDDTLQCLCHIYSQGLGAETGTLTFANNVPNRPQSVSLGSVPKLSRIVRLVWICRLWDDPRPSRTNSSTIELASAKFGRVVAEDGLTNRPRSPLT